MKRTFTLASAVTRNKVNDITVGPALMVPDAVEQM